MASKKQKKTKGKTISLQEFTASLETTSSGQNVVYAPKQPAQKSWADEVDEDDYADAVFANKVKLLLPSAPRASRGPDFNEADVPHKPPFTAHIGNISFDMDESDIYVFFKDLDVTELRLPRHQDNRIRGFGYVQFATREHLIEALSMNEQPLNGRPLRISLGQAQEGDRRGGGGGRNAPDQTPDDWRSAPQTELDAPPPRSNYDRPDFRGGRSDGYGQDFGGGRSDYGGSRGGGGGEYGMRRGYGGGGRYDNEGGSDFGGVRDRERGGDFGGRRGGDYGDRDRGRNFGGGGGYRDRRDGPVGSDEEEGTSTWRTNPPVQRGPPSQDDRPFRNQDRDGDNRDRRYGGGGGSRDMSPDFSDVRTRQPRPPSPEFVRAPYQNPNPPQYQRRTDTEEPETNREERKPSPPRERRKLVIAPRTLTQSAAEPVSSSSAIFGGARPVDTAAREREIEKKLAEQEEPRRGRVLTRAPAQTPEKGRSGPPSRSETMSPVNHTPTTPTSLSTNEHLPPIEDTPPSPEKAPSNTKQSDSSSHKSDSAPPVPPPSNAWAQRRERQETRGGTNIEEVNSGHGHNHEHYEDEGIEDGGSSRDHAHSPHPDSDHKDTNSEPEDERDLRLQREEADDEFQRVERRGRKSKPSLEQNYRPPQASQQRGGTYGSRGSAPRGGAGGPPPRRANNY